MYEEIVQRITNVSVRKVQRLKQGTSSYYALAMLAGFYVGIAMALIYTIGGLFAEAGSKLGPIVMGLSFGVSLSLVLMGGSELFTGNTMTMPMAWLEKKTTFSEVLQILGASFVGNFAGSAIFAVLFKLTGLTNGPTGAYFLAAAAKKMNLMPSEIFFRGLLCNVLVTLAVWTFYKMKSESGKLIMIFWCLFAFITSGYEHSVANMTVNVVALIIPHSEAISVFGMIKNLTFSALGNIVGGSIFVGLLYWHIADQEKKTG